MSSASESPTKTKRRARLALMPSSSGSCEANNRSNRSGNHHAALRSTSKAAPMATNRAGTFMSSKLKPVSTHTPNTTMPTAERNSASTAVTRVS